MAKTPEPERVEKLMSKLKERPGLFERVEDLVGEIEDGEGEPRTLDEVEEKVVEKSRALARTTLGEWMGEAAGGTARPEGARKAAKKKSGA